EDGFLRAAECFQRIAQRFTRMERHDIAEMRAHLRAELALVNEEVSMAVFMQQGKGERQRRVRHIRTTNVEHPCNRVRHGEHRGVYTACAEISRYPVDLL